jgi:SAM-dependent methyltransferase
VERDYVSHRGFRLAPMVMRDGMCGEAYGHDDYFFNSGIAEARKLIDKLGCNRDSRVVDIGCGVGRVAIGLLEELGQVQYHGLDASSRYVRWCRRHIERLHPSFRFIHVDVENERYNPKGRRLTEDFAFPLPGGQADIVMAWGLFTNMAPEDMRIYVREISRIAASGARVLLTLFVEERVPAVTINPDNYVEYKCSGPLHVVRYEREFLFSIFAEHGLTVYEFAHHAGVHRVSAIERRLSDLYLKKNGSSEESVGGWCASN